jgi:ankyrin repeat protein
MRSDRGQTFRMEACGVCADEISSSKFKTVCGHEFHVEFLREWIKNNETCPSCHQVFNSFFVEKQDLSGFNKKELFDLLDFLLEYEEYSIENVIERFDTIGWTEEEKYTTFNSACSKGHLKAARYLINKYKFSINSSSFKYLNWACDRGFHELVKLLIDAGADVTQVEPDGMNLLHRACFANSLETCTTLLGTGKFDVNYKYNDECPIHTAIRKGNQEIVMLLVENGANFDMEGFFLITPLILAINLENIDIATYLVEKGARFEKDSMESLDALYSACSTGNIDIVKFLVRIGVDVNSIGFNSAPLIAACENGNLEIVKFLIENGADINQVVEFEVPALPAACEHGHPEIVKLLIEKGADLNICCENSSSVLFAVARSNDVECFEILLNGGLDIKLENGQTPYMVHSDYFPFMEAIYFNNLKILKKFLESGMVVSVEGRRKGLHLAIKEGFEEIVDYLISIGVDFDYDCVMNSMLPLCLACQLDRTEIALNLIKAGASLNTPCAKGCYPIHQTCINGNMPILESLIEHDVNLNLIRDIDHSSSIYLAAINNHYEILQKLLESGANPNIKHISGDTALHKSIIGKKWDFVELLLKSGADARIENKKNCSSYELLLTSNDLINEDLLKEAILCLEVDGKLNDYFFTACEKGKLKLLENIFNYANKEHLLKSKNLNGNAAIHISVIENQVNVFERLVESGADFEETDEYGRTALLLACEYGQVNMFRRLIDLGANFKKTTHDGSSALHLVASSGNVEVAKELILKGLDPNLENNKGQSALEIAKSKNYDLISGKKVTDLKNAFGIVSNDANISF